MPSPRYPSLYQINTRVWLTELSRTLGRPRPWTTFPTPSWIAWPSMGFDWVWFLSVWQTGLAGQRVSRTNPEWRREFQETLPDLREEDIAGSGFAITGYTVHADLGGDAALARLRERLRQRGLRLMLDFVPNHTAWIIPGSRTIPSTSSPAPSPTWPARRRTTPGSKRKQRRSRCWPTAAIRTSPAGPTRCSSTTPTRRRRKR